MSRTIRFESTALVDPRPLSLGQNARATALRSYPRISGLATLAALALSVAAGCGDTSQTDSSDASDNDEEIGSGDDGMTTGDPDPMLNCEPGERRCADDMMGIEQCLENGKDWELVLACGEYEQCKPCEGGDTECPGPVCFGPCQVAEELPSSAGCSFMATRVLRLFEDEVDGLIVTNPNEDTTVKVWLYEVPEGKNDEELLNGPVEISPGDAQIFILDASPILGESSLFRTGGLYHVVSDAPVIVYQHSPLAAALSNDASLLIPDTGLSNTYVVSSYGTHKNGPSYFEVIAIEDDTMVTWRPPVATSGNGIPIKSVEGGGLGKQEMDRFDSMRIAARMADDPDDIKDPKPNEDPTADEYDDLSGAIVQSDKPIWVVGATNCAYIPYRKLYCDHLEEQLIPLEYWGRSYVAAHSPVRGTEVHIWRVYAGDDDVTVTTEPALPGTPFTLPFRGAYRELIVPTGVSFTVNSDKPVMPVQYLVGRVADAGTGDPSMVQAVPTEQFLDRYVFVTGVGYEEHYVQVIRPVGAPDVTVDDEIVTGFTTIGGFEVADWPIMEGPHVAESSGEFGIIQFGYTKDASYAYPGGMRRDTIFVP